MMAEFHLASSVSGSWYCACLLTVTHCHTICYYDKLKYLLRKTLFLSKTCLSLLFFCTHLNMYNL